MEDIGHAGEQRREIGRQQVVLAEREPVLSFEPGQVLLLYASRVEIGESVHADHLLTGVEQALRQVRADEASDAGDQASLPMARSRKSRQSFPRILFAAICISGLRRCWPPVGAT